MRSRQEIPRHETRRAIQKLRGEKNDEDDRFVCYGEPKKRTVTDEGEQWTYWLNFGEFVGKHMIPFFFSTEQIRIGVLIFGPDGRVKKFNWDTPSA